MNCDRIEQLLPRYHGGDLADVERAIVVEHLSSCNRCRESSAVFAALEEILVERRNGLPRPGSISDAVLARLRIRRTRSFPASRWAVPVFAVAAALAVSLLPLAFRESLARITGRIETGYGTFVTLLAAMPEKMVEAAGGEWWILLTAYLALTVSFVIAGRIACKRILQD